MLAPNLGLLTNGIVEARRVKTRAGCMQCKRRKVKCDQSLPGCLQCSRQRLECPGYEKPLKWIDDSEKTKNLVSTPDIKRHIKVRGISGNGHACISSAFRERVVKMQPPCLHEQLNDESSALVQHYFTKVNMIAGCFNSDISPFKTIPATMMTYSKPVFLLLQASSAAQLSRQYPRMRYKALTLQSEAFSAVRSEIANVQSTMVVSDELMLSCIIAGLTSSWYDVNDLGSCHVRGSQVLLSLWLMSKSSRLKYQETFILGAYVYWLAISALVTGDPRSSLDFLEGLQETVRKVEMSYDILDDSNIPNAHLRIFPHPLTGFSMQTFICVGKVGALCRLAHVDSGQNFSTAPSNGVDQQEVLEEKARCIEIELLGQSQDRQSNFHDPQDSHTSIDEILGVGEAYRCAGLLQLYMTFPQLLRQNTSELSQQKSGFLEKELLFDLNRGESTGGNGFTPAQHNWLRSLAFHILSILENIPSTSSTRVLQGFPVLIAATWLVDPVPEYAVPFEHSNLPLSISSKSKELWRVAVRDGLLMHAENVGLQQVSRILEIVEEVWRRDDDGEGKCDWFVVVTSKGVQTLYG